MRALEEVCSASNLGFSPAILFMDQNGTPGALTRRGRQGHNEHCWFQVVSDGFSLGNRAE